MNMLSAPEIRQAFLDFFKSKQHEIVQSAPLVVKNDPTLMFINSGMAPFKDFFLGIGKPSNPRIADTQKCLRVSGKHNDLEEVGVDTYHHTMFEMLGNWSFGDPTNPAAGYFKKEAIAWSWEFLTEVLKLDKDKLYVTIFEGNEAENIPKDEEAYNEWKKVIAADRILLGNKKDNFWEMGETGPCGPCTEIHVDCRTDEERKQIDGATLVNNDHPQVIEIWNNVFIQFNRKKDNSLEPLPAKHVDTGMGFERLVRVLQQKTSNYDTDVFTGTIEAIEKIVNKKYDRSDSKEAIAFRVLSDHIRAVAFTISDGQLPSNTGAGYVIRRILRRAVRYYFSYLDRKEPLLHLLVPVLAKQFETVFPELQQQVDFVSKVVLEEETSFLKTLENGLKRIDVIFTESTDKTVNGKSAFELHSTYGFPIDLTKLIASEKGFDVNESEYEKIKKEDQALSRSSTELNVDDWINIQDGKSVFVGYDTLETKAQVLKYRKIKSKGKEQYQIVLDKTPFYAESGGQVGDVGHLIFPSSNGEGWQTKSDELRLNITDTKKENDLIVHFVDGIPADLSGEVLATVDAETRRKTTIHHSSTHLLQAALQQVLGKHIAQKGSLNNSEYLRFDFSHFAKMTDEEIQKVENLVNEKIRQNIPVVIKEMSKDEAVKSGAMALFGEKYGDVVRVVIMDEKYSIELCGGTHVGATGELGLFKITSESAVAAGVRRVEAVCGELALDYTNEIIKQLNNVKEALKNPKDLSKSIEQLQDENAGLKKTIENLEIEIINANENLIKYITVESFNFAIGRIDNISKNSQKYLVNKIKNKVNSDIIILVSKNFNNNIVGEINIKKEITDNNKSILFSNLSNKICQFIGTRGGGSNNNFSLGGIYSADFENINNLNEEKIKQFINESKRIY